MLQGSGTNWSYFEAAAKNFNLSHSVRATSSISDAIEALQNSKLVISSQSAGLFTTGGHFIVLTGIDSNGGIGVNDPNSANAKGKGYNDRKFTSSEIGAAGAQYFIFE